MKLFFLKRFSFRIDPRAIKLCFACGFLSCFSPSAFSFVPIKQSSVPVSAQVSLPPGGIKMFGLNFSPYVDGQDPNKRTPISEAQIRERMEKIAPYTQWVRTFSMVDGLEKAGAIAHSLGLKVALGAWLGPEVFPWQYEINHLNIDNLIAAGQRGEADLLIVGSEVLRRNDLEERKLIEYVNKVKAEVPGIPVAVADIDENILKAKGLRDASTAIFVNIYPFWESQRLEWASFNLLARYKRVVALTPGKPVYISETGWPSCGDPNGLSIPNPTNASSYLLGYQTLVSTLNIPGFYFEAFDEEWKAKTEEGSRGGCWGMWDTGGNLKPGNNAFFLGESAPNTWEGYPPVEGPGIPTIFISSAPSYGDKAVPVSGKALHVSPELNHVSMFIHVGSHWYIKPFNNIPFFIFQPDGTWSSSMVTGGVDEFADKIRVYIFPEDFIPPLGHDPENPAGELSSHALAQMEIFRTPHSLGCFITSPSDGAIVSTPTLISVDAQSLFGVTGVTFSIDGVVRSTDSFHPFEYLWDPSGETSGPHTLGTRVTEITGKFVDTSIEVVKP